MEIKVFLTQQLLCMLPPLACKTLSYLINWQKFEYIKYYPKQMCKFMHITEKELEIAIQTLIDNNLISVSSIDGNYVFTLERKTIMSYLNVPMQKVQDHEGFKLSTNVTWNVDEQKSSNDINSMSKDELKTLLLRIQASLNEKEQCEKLIKSNEPIENDLPFQPMQKRYEYWSSENGKPIKKFTNWFEWTNEDYMPKYQFGKKLLNEYRS